MNNAYTYLLRELRKTNENTVHKTYKAMFPKRNPNTTNTRNATKTEAWSTMYPSLTEFTNKPERERVQEVNWIKFAFQAGSLSTLSTLMCLLSCIRRLIFKIYNYTSLCV